MSYGVNCRSRRADRKGANPVGGRSEEESDAKAQRKRRRQITKARKNESTKEEDSFPYFVVSFFRAFVICLPLLL
jgi:hypothetical protein